MIAKSNTTVNKRFVLVVPLYSSFELFFSELCDQMVAEGWEITVFTRLPDTYKYLNPHIKVEHLRIPRGMQVMQYFQTAKVLKRRLKEINPFIVHAHFQTAALVTRLTGLCFFKKFTTSHGLIFNTKNQQWKFKLFQVLELFIYNYFDTVYVLNQQDFIALQNTKVNVKLYPTKGLGCQISDFDDSSFSEQTNLEFKKSLGIAKNDFVFIYVGRLTDFKGINIVYQAFKSLQKSVSSVKLLVVGDFDPIHPSGLTPPEFDAYVQDETIVKVGFSAEVNKYLAIADTMVFASTKEGLPVNLMESICMGVPIITLDSRGCSDVVDENKYGSILKEKSAVLFEAEMRKFMLDSEIITDIKSNQLRDRHLFDRRLFIDYQIAEYNLVVHQKMTEL